MCRPRFSATVKAMDITGPARTATLDGVIDAARRLAPVRPTLSQARVLVRRVSLWPSVRVELRGDDAALYSRAGDTFVAQVGLATGALTVFVIADLAHSVVLVEPLARVTRDGVGLDVRDADSLQAGERLIRWRIDLERSGPQWREASP
jgi:hypothetical protein